MYTKINYILALIIFIVVVSCKDEPSVAPPPITPGINDTITITITQVTHRSIVIDLQTTINNPSSLVQLYQRLSNTDTLVTEYPITNIDTSIVDDNNGIGLQLDTEYSYYALRKTTSAELKDTSNIVMAKTLAATNFNYIWQEFALGDPGSVLYDVWGTDENNVYAVGGVYFNDISYGVIHWNGVDWKPSSRFGGGVAIHGFSGNDIWTVGGTIYHYNGVSWNEILFYDQVLVDNLPYYSVWGTNSNNVYFGSGRGKIIHWNGINAQIVYNNPDQVFVNDLDGYASDFIIGVGTGMVPPLLAVKYDGINWSNLPISSNWSLNAVSIVTKNQILFSGGGIFELQNKIFTRIYNSGYYIWDIEYNPETGVAVSSGSYDGIYINNGLEWRDFSSQISSDETTYSGIFLTNNVIFCVGRNDTQAKIIIGNN